MLIVSPRASSIAPRHADVMPLPNDDTTPPVMNTYEVILSVCFLVRDAENEKGLDSKRRRLLRALVSNPCVSTPSLDIRRF